MQADTTHGGIGIWQAEGHSMRIEYSLVVMEELRRAAEEGFQKIGHGGLEVGGVLFGTQEDKTIRLLDWRPLECEHAHGPGFLLSANDQAALGKLLEEAASDQDLTTLEPLGWWHSHTRSGIYLSPEDLEIQNNFFPELWQIALVVRPVKDHPLRAGFFFRATDGGIYSIGSLSEFTLESRPDLRVRSRRSGAPRPRSGVPAPPVVEPAPAAAWTPPAPSTPSPPPAPARPAEIPAPVFSSPIWNAKPSKPVIRWRLVVAVFGILLTAWSAALTRAYWAPPLLAVLPSFTRAGPLALRINETGSQLLIEWNRDADVLRGARGVMRVRDGKQERQIRLEADELRRGSVTYARESEDVEVRLSVVRPGRPDVPEIARFLGPAPPEGSSTQLEGAQQQRTQMEGETKKLRDQLRQEAARTNQLRESIRLLEQRMDGSSKKGAAPAQ